MPSVTVKGMSCNHCRMSVTKAVAAVPGVKDVDVNLERGEAAWTEAAPVDVEAVKEAIRKTGFDVE